MNWSSFTFGVPQIPQLAAGGIISPKQLTPLRLDGDTPALSLDEWLLSTAVAAEAPEALVCNGNLGRHCDEAAAVPESRLSYGGCTGDTVLDACHMATI